MPYYSYLAVYSQCFLLQIYLLCCFWSSSLISCVLLPCSWFFMFHSIWWNGGNKPYNSTATAKTQSNRSLKTHWLQTILHLAKRQDQWAIYSKRCLYSAALKWWQWCINHCHHIAVQVQSHSMSAQSYVSFYYNNKQVKLKIFDGLS